MGAKTIVYLTFLSLGESTPGLIDQGFRLPEISEGGSTAAFETLIVSAAVVEDESY